MNMHPGCAALEQIGENLLMNLGIGTYRPTLRHLLERNFRLGAVLNGFRVANVEIGFPGLRTETPELCGLIELALAADYNVLLNADRASFSTFGIATIRVRLDARLCRKPKWKPFLPGLIRLASHC